MLTFLRKHQKFFFIVITVITIASFCFFGTFSSFSSPEKAADKEVARIFDGSRVMESEVQQFLHFFSFVNSSFLENDLLSSGLGVLLAENFFEALKPDFRARLERVKHFHPYVHPLNKEISAEKTWALFAPRLLEHLNALKMEGVTPHAFSLYAQLYLDQKSFSPTLLKRVLYYQLKQKGDRSYDPLLSEERLTLFGYRNLEEWFGRAYLEKVALFILSAAKMAEQKGYALSKEEVKADLLKEAALLLKGSKPGQGQEVSSVEAEQLLRHQFQTIHLSEAQGLKVWKKVLLCRRLFDEVGKGMFLDPLLYNQFAAYTGEKSVVDLYELPQVLRFSSFRSFLKFQFYIDTVAPKNRTHLAKLPSQFYTVAEMEKRCPELVYSKVVVEMAKFKKDELAEKVTLKETWEWETEEKGWAVLKAQFPHLLRQEGVSKEDRLKMLDQLKPSERLKVDQFVRRKIVDEKPHWIEEVLAEKKMQKREIKLCAKGALYPFAEGEDPVLLLKFFQQAPLDTRVVYTAPDHNTYYAFKVLEKPTPKQVMTFQDALQYDWIGELLKRKLEEVYPERFRKGGEEIVEELGALFYEDVLHLLTPTKEPLAYYAPFRLKGFVEEARKSVIKEGEKSLYLTPMGNRLKDQWLLLRQKKEIKRSDKSDYASSELFQLPVNSWSNVYVSDKGNLSFAHIENRLKGSDSAEELLTEGQKILDKDARRVLMHQLLTQLKL